MRFRDSRDKQKLPQLVARGRELHIAGDLPAAEQAFREALTLLPDDPESLHRLGMILDARGDHAGAVDLMQRSLLRAPHVPEFFNNLGEALRKSGRLAEARRALERSIELRAANPEALNNLATVLLETAGENRDDAALALTCARSAAALAPHIALVRVTVGRALLASRNEREAASAFREAIALEAKNAAAHMGLLTALATAGEDVGAALDVGVAGGVSRAELHSAAAAGHLNACRHHAATAHIEQGLAADPNHFTLLVNRANVLLDQAEPAEALEAFRRAQAVSDSPGLRRNIGLALLFLGRFVEGLPEYEHRPKQPPPTDVGNPRPPLAPGQDVRGRTILLVGEQGLGDTIQFIRYATILAARGANVLAQVDARLASIVSTVAGIQRVFTETDPARGFDAYSPLASLPYVLGTTLDTIPADVPYIRADPSLVERWRTRIGGGPTDGILRVGIAWQGNPRHAKDRLRSIPLAALNPLAQVPGVKLYSLQKNDGREQLAQVAAMDPPMAVEDLDAELTDFAQTAAAVEALDVVITVDSAVAHLCGALARPVWTLNSLAADWRWMTRRTDSPWYPTMRLYRQTRLGDWTDVVAQITNDLRSPPEGKAPRRTV